MAAEHFDQEELLFVPLGGCGEIGMNLNLFGFGKPGAHKWIIVDIGVTFGDLTTPGIDVIMPDPEFIEGLKDDLLGIVATHGHEDHIGAVAYLWPRLRCPVYATPFTAKLIEGKLIERDLQDDVPLEIVELGGKFDLGPFGIEYITLTHSILEPNALSIETPLGTLLHTGDWKIDPAPMLGQTTNETRLREIGDSGVLAIICDSTNVFVEGQAGSESDVRKELIKLIATLEGRVAVTTFASNVARLSSVIEAARSNNRSIVLVGRSMLRMCEVARETGYLTDFSDFVPESEAGYLPPENVLYLCTGSQGEPRAALSRIASGEHRHVTLEEGDAVVFSSRVIPGNERSIHALQNQLSGNGVEVISAEDHDIHVSGHPCRGELAQMYQWIRPEIAIPVHGEMRHLKEHEKLCHELQIPNVIASGNGAMIRLAPDGPELIDQVPQGRLYLDGAILEPAGSSALRERRKIAAVGLIVTTIVLTDSGDILEDSMVRTYGMPDQIGLSGRTLSQALQEDLDDALENLTRRQSRSDADVEDLCRRVLRARLKTSWGKRPQLDIQIVRVED